MTYLDEFSEEMHPSGDELEKIWAAKGEDCSWHNDAAPSWIWGDNSDDTSVYLYVNPLDKEKREFPEYPRFIAMLSDDDCTTVYAGDSLDDALMAIDNKVKS